jgi:hypothetical protein
MDYPEVMQMQGTDVLGDRPWGSVNIVMPGWPRLGKAVHSIFVLPLLLALSACGPQWSIEKIRVNPSAPLQPPADVTPLTLVASVPATIVNLSHEVRFKRSSGFNGPIDFQTDVNLRPTGGSNLFVPGRSYGAKPSISRVESLLGILCRRIEPSAGEPSVELEIFHAFSMAGVPASVVARDKAVATVSVDVKVVSTATDSGGRRGTISLNSERPFVVSCFRDSPIM